MLLPMCVVGVRGSGVEFRSCFVMYSFTLLYYCLTLKVPITTKVICFVACWIVLGASSLNSANQDQTAPIGAVWSGFTLFASIVTLVNNVSKYMYMYRQLKQGAFLFIFASALRVECGYLSYALLSRVSSFWCHRLVSFSAVAVMVVLGLWCFKSQQGAYNAYISYLSVVFFYSKDLDMLWKMLHRIGFRYKC